MLTKAEADLRIADGGHITRDELSQLMRYAMTAGDLARYSAACPEWVAEKSVQLAQLQTREDLYLAEEAPLREDLRGLGYQIKWVWDFVNTKENYYASAIPTLVAHLQRPYSHIIREGIARSLAIKEARGLAATAIIATLGEAGLGRQLRWALANTLTVVAERSDRGAIRELLTVEADADVKRRLTRALRTAGRP